VHENRTAANADGRGKGQSYSESEDELESDSIQNNPLNVRYVGVGLKIRAMYSKNDLADQ
jgi:hypothetical protein